MTAKYFVCKQMSKIVLDDATLLDQSTVGPSVINFELQPRYSSVGSFEVVKVCDTLLEARNYLKEILKQTTSDYWFILPGFTN